MKGLDLVLDKADHYSAATVEELTEARDELQGLRDKSEDVVSLADLREWLAPGQAGRILGFSGTWVKKLCQRGQLRGTETALGWLVDPASVVAFIESKKAKLDEESERLDKRRFYPAPKRGRRDRGRAIKNPIREDTWTE